MKKLLEKVTKLLAVGASSRNESSSSVGITPSRVLATIFVGVIFLAIVGDAKGYLDSYVDRQIAEARSQIVMQINAETQGRVAQHQAVVDSITQLLEAEKTLNGELIAALAIRIPADTVYVQMAETETVFDTTEIGVTRTATLTDTTHMGIEVTVDAVAPANQDSPIQLGFSLFFPEQRPEIGFVETEFGTIATVSWLNQEFQIEAPFFRPNTNNPKPLRINAGARLLFPPASVEYNMYASLEYRPNADWSIQAPIGLMPGGTYFGLEVEKTLIAFDGIADLLWPF